MDGQPQAGEESAIHQRTAALRRGCRTSPRPRPFVVEFSNGVADVRSSLTLIRRTAESLVVTDARLVGDFSNAIDLCDSLAWEERWTQPTNECSLCLNGAAPASSRVRMPTDAAAGRPDQGAHGLRASR